jgi:hypothetical protein
VCIDLGPGGGGGGGPGPGGTNVPAGQPQEERGMLEQLVCSLCAPICKEIGINLDQQESNAGPEGVQLKQPGRERIRVITTRKASDKIREKRLHVVNMRRLFQANVTMFFCKF